MKKQTNFFAELKTCSLNRKMQTEWQWDENLIIGMIIEGSPILHLGNHTYQLHPGDGFFINQEVRYYFENQTNSYVFLYEIVFSPRLIGGSMDSIFWQKYLNPLLHNQSFPGTIFFHHNKADKENLDHCKYAFRIMQYHITGYEFLFRNELSFIILDLYGRQTILPSGISQKNLRNEERIRQMLSFIEAHYMDDIVLTDIADSADISISECNRCFKTVLHTTPMQYLLHYRLQKAAQMLLETDLDIQDISSTCGITDMNYFSRCFRKYYDTTPTLFRKNRDNKRE